MEAIRSACDFFRIPYPELVYDLTNSKGGRTMFVNNNSDDMANDILCYNMDQLIGLNVNSKDSFSLIMTHECAHRVLQATRFPGINNGAWENELAADFLMGVRAGLWNIDESKVAVGLLLTNGSPSHPEGTLRALFIRHGKYVSQIMRRQGVPLTIQNLINEFMSFRNQNLNEIHRFQRKYYRF
jgi:hypothetical protein